jgi:hypothetical protein
MRRTLTLFALLGLMTVALAAPVAAKDFGTIYVDGEPYRTFGNPARVDPGTGTDPIIAFTNFDQGGVAQYAPGDGSHGGRWEVTMATWNDPEKAHLLTSYGEVMHYVGLGEISLQRAPEADFRCPILPNG